MAADDEAAKEPDLAARTAELVELVVSAIRDRSVRPAYTALRIVVTAVVVFVIGTVAFIAMVIGLVRLLDHNVFPGRVWATYFLLGGIFIGLGALSFVFGARLGRRHGAS